VHSVSTLKAKIRPQSFIGGSGSTNTTNVGAAPPTASSTQPQLASKEMLPPENTDELYEVVNDAQSSPPPPPPPTRQRLATGDGGDTAPPPPARPRLATGERGATAYNAATYKEEGVEDNDEMYEVVANPATRSPTQPHSTVATSQLSEGDGDGDMYEFPDGDQSTVQSTQPPPTPPSITRGRRNGPSYKRTVTVFGDRGSP
jgi:hypothetical protein